jgi:hypothetical protein
VNGIVKRQHHTICESLVKACKGDDSKWPAMAPLVFWANCTMICKSTSLTPFYMVHGIEPILPFFLTLATFLVPDLVTPLMTTELIAIHVYQLKKHSTNLAEIHNCILKSHFTLAQQFVQHFESTICNFDFKPGNLVLVQNSSMATNIGNKTQPCYLGPMIIV